ncbi:MAG: hypothetical protein QM667_07955 [Asticcacaulis sp.]
MERPLTASECIALPPALMAALDAATDIGGVRLMAREHPVSKLARFFGHGPLIIVRRRRIFWPDLPDDLSKRPETLALLAHELTHVWQYATGMTLLHYLLRERGRYSYRLDPQQPFRAYGYEQQAAMVEDMVRLNSGLPPRWGRAPVAASLLKRCIRFD